MSITPARILSILTVTQNMIRALVESTRAEAYTQNALISDVIKGKGGGLILVLHGPPVRRQLPGHSIWADANHRALARP